MLELCETRMQFKPTAKTPVTIMDGRMFVKRNKEKWDWLILDAFRGGFVPPHLKTEEFYRECAARLSDRGVFVSNLHATSQLYFSDLKTIQKVFPQVVLFETLGRGNVIACAVNYSTPVITDNSKWPTAEWSRSLFSRAGSILPRCGVSTRSSLWIGCGPQKSSPTISRRWSFSTR